MATARRLSLIALRAVSSAPRLRSNTALLSRRYPQLLSTHSALRRSLSTTRTRCHDVFPSQAEDPNNAALLSSLKTSPLPQTLTEKIVQQHAVGLADGKYVKAGDYVTLAPKHCMSHDNSWPIASKFMSIGATKIHDPKQIVMTLDHDVQNKSEKNLKKYKQIEEFAKKHGVDFYPAGRGIGHQIMVENSYAWPGTMVVASDSHSNHYGGVGCLGTPIVRTDACAIWSTGVLPKGVAGKDVIVALCGLFNNDEVLNHAIEFAGSEETMRSLPVDYRLTIANMTTEFGALSGLFPVDDTLKAWLRSKATMSAIDEAEGREGNHRCTHERIDQLYESKLAADPGAQYAKYLHLDLSTLEPYVSGPNSVKVAAPLSELEAQNLKVNKAYLVSCTNSRASDIAAAAKVFRDAAEKNDGKIPKIADGVKFYIAAASILEQEAAEEAGDWQVLIEAGAEPLPSGCGPCIGLGTGLLEPGEVGISASNRNFKGRMGSPDARAYLSSPEVVAASALAGIISGPHWYEKPEGWNGVVRGEGEQGRMITADEALQKIINQLDNMLESGEKEFGAKEEEVSATESVQLYPGFPEKISGSIIWCGVDNLNTDGIYPGKYTYDDSITKERMAEVCMENYDPKFASIAQPGDILVSGFNFGCGSSREQAATAILYKGIPLVISGSFGNIFSRNSINNALMGLEVPKLVHRLQEVFSAPTKEATSEIDEPQGNKENQQSLDSPPTAPTKTVEKRLTIRTGWTLTWDVKKSQIEVIEGESGRKWTEKVSELGPSVQEIVATGGLEKWVKKQISAN